LSNGGQTTLLDLLGIKLNGSLTELESLLHKSSEFADSSSLVPEDLLSMRSADDDFCSRGRDTDFAARVALFSEFAGEEFIELGEEDSVGDELTGQPGGFLGTEKEGDLGCGSGFVHYAFIDVRVRDVSNKRCQRTHHRATAEECWVGAYLSLLGDWAWLRHDYYLVVVVVSEAIAVDAVTRRCNFG
jgi:hypothetical protein